MFISVFNYMNLKDCHPPELQWCWYESRLVKLPVICLFCRKFAQSFLWVFLLFAFTKWPNLCRIKWVIACAKRKRPPLVRGHHWSPASTVLAGDLSWPFFITLLYIVCSDSMIIKHIRGNSRYFTDHFRIDYNMCL